MNENFKRENKIQVRNFLVYQFDFSFYKYFETLNLYQYGENITVGLLILIVDPDKITLE